MLSGDATPTDSGSPLPLACRTDTCGPLLTFVLFSQVSAKLIIGEIVGDRYMDVRQADKAAFGRGLQFSSHPASARGKSF